MSTTPLRRFGVVDFVLFLYVLVMAGGVRAGYLMLEANNGKDSGPLAVQDQNPTEQADRDALADSVQAPTEKRPFFSNRFAPLSRTSPARKTRRPRPPTPRPATRCCSACWGRWSRRRTSAS